MISQNSSSHLFSFPEDWIGTWKGDLQIYKDGHKVQEIPMQIINKRTNSSDTLLWSIIYGEDSIKGLREYYLIIDSIEDNHFVIDERNSILIDGYCFDNAYFSTFNVMGNQITSIYRLLNSNELLFGIIFNKTEAISTTGNKVINGDSIPEVLSYEISTYQKAVLTKATG
jgi:hypothetical protein